MASETIAIACDSDHGERIVLEFAPNGIRFGFQATARSGSVTHFKELVPRPRIQELITCLTTSNDAPHKILLADRHGVRLECQIDANSRWSAVFIFHTAIPLPGLLPIESVRISRSDLPLLLQCLGLAQD